MRIGIGLLVAAALLQGCENPRDQAVAGGALAGAAISGVSSGGDPRQTAIGAGVGALAGALIAGANAEGQCLYRRSDGSEFRAPCPEN